MWPFPALQERVPVSSFQGEVEVTRRDTKVKLWWCLPGIPALARLRQGDCEFPVSLGYTVRPQNNNRKRRD